MDYSKINKTLYILLNLSWAVIVVPFFIYFVFTNETVSSWENVSIIFLITSVVSLQFIGYLKLRKGELYIPIMAVVVLTFIIDLDGFMFFNTLLLNIDLIYTAAGQVDMELKFLQGPNFNWNVQLDNFKFNKIGFNAVAYIQVFFFQQQVTNQTSESDDAETLAES